MRIEAIFLLGVAVFFGIVGIIYWFWGAGYALGDQGGTIMLVGTTLLGLLPGGYYLWWSRRMRPRPEDRTDGSLQEGAGVIGSFPNSSIWPFVLGMGVFLVVLSAVFGLWLIAPGFALMLSAGIGATVESRRGGTV
jgi:Cytochrome c oxidase subunit IV